MTSSTSIELSEKLEMLAKFQHDHVKTMLSDMDGMNCAGWLVEAARVMDYEHLMNSSDVESDHLQYPEFDMLTRGWNPLLALLLPRLPDLKGMPIRESTPQSRGIIRSVLLSLGKSSLLHKAAAMAKQGFLVQTENGDINRIILKSAVYEESDHYLDRLENDRMEAAMKETQESVDMMSQWKMNETAVREKIQSLVFPFITGHGNMVGYDADFDLDMHFLGLVMEKTLNWRSEAGIHPDTKVGTIEGADVSTVILFLISFYMKHIHFVGLGSKLLQDTNYAMSMTIWKEPETLIKSLAEFTQLPEDRIRNAMNTMVVGRDDAALFKDEGTPLVPFLIEITEGYWLSPVSSIFRNPFQTWMMLNEKRNPELDRFVREHREPWMITDLYHLFLGERYHTVEKPVILKRNGKTLTDIDAAVLDLETGDLALFQLKWQDFGSNSLTKLRSRAKNFVTQVDKWAESVNGWIEEFGEAELCKKLLFPLPEGKTLTSIKLFALGRSNARFQSYGYTQNSELAACNWPQFVRLRHAIGSSDSVIPELYKRIQMESRSHVTRTPIPYEFTTGETEVYFEDLWSYTKDDEAKEIS